MLSSAVADRAAEVENAEPALLAVAPDYTTSVEVIQVLDIPGFRRCGMQRHSYTEGR